MVSVSLSTDKGVVSIYWQAAEGPMTLLCVCLPSMFVLWRRLLGAMRHRLSRSMFSGNGHSLPTSEGYSEPKRQTKPCDLPTFEMELKSIPRSHHQVYHSREGSEITILPENNRQCKSEVSHTRPPSAYIREEQRPRNVVYVQRDITIS
jgi:hypothetical protein